MRNPVRVGVFAAAVAEVFATVFSSVANAAPRNPETILREWCGKIVSDFSTCSGVNCDNPSVKDLQNCLQNFALEKQKELEKNNELEKQEELGKALEEQKESGENDRASILAAAKKSLAANELHDKVMSEYQKLKERKERSYEKDGETFVSDLADEMNDDTAIDYTIVYENPKRTCGDVSNARDEVKGNYQNFIETGDKNKILNDVDDNIIKDNLQKADKNLSLAEALLDNPSTFNETEFNETDFSKYIQKAERSIKKAKVAFASMKKKWNDPDSQGKK